MNAGCFLEAYLGGRKTFQVNMIKLLIAEMDKFNVPLSFQMDQSCSSTSTDRNLGNESLNQSLLLHCTCPGCTATFHLTWICAGVLVVFIVFVFVPLYKKTRYVNYMALYISKSDCQYERLQCTSV